MACCETPKGSLSSVTEAGPVINRARIALRVGSDNAANVRLNESTTLWLCDNTVYVKRRLMRCGKSRLTARAARRDLPDRSNPLSPYRVAGATLFAAFVIGAIFTYLQTVPAVRHAVAR